MSIEDETDNDLQLYGFITRFNRFTDRVKRIAKILVYAFSLIVWPILCIVFIGNFYTMYHTSGLPGSLLILYAVLFGFLFVVLAFISDKGYFTKDRFSTPFSKSELTFPHAFIRNAEYTLSLIVLNILEYFASTGMLGKIILFLQLAPLFAYFLLTFLLLQAIGSNYNKPLGA